MWICVYKCSVVLPKVQLHTFEFVFLRFYSICLYVNKERVEKAEAKVTQEELNFLASLIKINVTLCFFMLLFHVLFNP